MCQASMEPAALTAATTDVVPETLLPNLLQAHILDILCALSDFIPKKWHDWALLAKSLCQFSCEVRYWFRT